MLGFVHMPLASWAARRQPVYARHSETKRPLDERRHEPLVAEARHLLRHHRAGLVGAEDPRAAPPSRRPTGRRTRGVQRCFMSASSALRSRGRRRPRAAWASAVASRALPRFFAAVLGSATSFVGRVMGGVGENLDGILGKRVAPGLRAPWYKSALAKFRTTRVHTSRRRHWG